MYQVFANRGDPQQILQSMKAAFQFGFASTSISNIIK